MRRQKITKILGSAILTASIGITGCAMNATVETTAEETTEATT